MKILGGNQYIFYSESTGSLEKQLENCLHQLEEYMNENQIYPGSLIRHNIFVNVSTQVQYDQVKPKLVTMAKRRFPMPLIINIIAQKPAQGDLALETTHLAATQWNCIFKESKHGACQLVRKGKEELIIGAIQVNNSQELQKNAEAAFEDLEALLNKCDMNFSNLIKQWNYIERLLDEDIYIQRYQAFNDVRTRYYESDFEGVGFPASTEVGMTVGGIIIEFIAIKKREEQSLTVNNPMQKAPHLYSENVLAKEGAYENGGPTTPKLERARTLSIDKQQMLFISGTSAIIGEKTTAPGDVKEQSILILENIKKIISAENLAEAGVEKISKADFSLVKAYINPKENAELVYDVLEPVIKDTPILLVMAELPRKEILVELESELIFAR